MTSRIWLNAPPKWNWRFHAYHCVRYNATHQDDIVGASLEIINRINTHCKAVYRDNQNSFTTGGIKIHHGFGHPIAFSKVRLLTFNYNHGTIVIEVVMKKPIVDNKALNEHEIRGVIIHAPRDSNTDNEIGLLAIIRTQLVLALMSAPIPNENLMFWYGDQL